LLDREKWKQRFKTILSLDSHPGHIAVGFAMGVFISFTPPIPGMHTLLALSVAFLFRLNKLTCITGAWVNTPLTVIPSVIASYKIGELVLGRDPVELDFSELDWDLLLDLLDSHGTPILIGSSIIGFAAAIIAYFGCYYLIVRFRQRDEALAELTREMVETGEELD
jgi:uncharacterized protein (DUF2062 family)